jgi:putative modified peptide
MSFQLPEAIADALLAKLGHDDDFRDHFIRDARSALASLGFGPAADGAVGQGIWLCLRVDQLASKESIRSAHGSLRRQLTAEKASYNPITLSVTSVRQHAA